MNIIKRLRHRETTNIKQQFAHTATTLESIIGNPDIVVPIREAVQPTTKTRLLKETEYFFSSTRTTSHIWLQEIKSFPHKKRQLQE